MKTSAVPDPSRTYSKFKHSRAQLSTSNVRGCPDSAPWDPLVFSPGPWEPLKIAKLPLVHDHLTRSPTKKDLRFLDETSHHDWRTAQADQKIVLPKVTPLSVDEGSGSSETIPIGRVTRSQAKRVRETGSSEDVLPLPKRSCILRAELKAPARHGCTAIQDSLLHKAVRSQSCR